MQAQSAPLHEEIKRLQTELLEAKQQSAAEQEELRVLKDELDRLKDTMERKAKTDLEASDTVLLTSLLNERGLRTHGEYTSFYQAVGESQHGWSLWKDAVIPKESTQVFLAEQVHLVLIVFEIPLRFQAFVSLLIMINVNSVVVLIYVLRCVKWSPRFCCKVGIGY